MLLEGKVALVTGASRGIGRAIALRLAQEGAAVAINYAGNTAAAEEVKSMIEAQGGKAIIVQADVSDGQAVDAMIKTVVDELGGLDILVNNAGITSDGLFVRMSPEQWEKVININLSSAFYVTHSVVKHMMKARRGSIVNMSSVVGISGNAGQANYSASKAGLIGLTKSLAKELGSRNIRVNAVAPGFINTKMTENLDPTKMLDLIPLKRLGEVEDIAKTVKFLAMDADYITGQVVKVDGGLMI